MLARIWLPKNFKSFFKVRKVIVFVGRRAALPAPLPFKEKAASPLWNQLSVVFLYVFLTFLMFFMFYMCFMSIITATTQLRPVCKIFYVVLKNKFELICEVTRPSGSSAGHEHRLNFSIFFMQNSWYTKSAHVRAFRARTGQQPWSRR